MLTSSGGISPVSFPKSYYTNTKRRAAARSVPGRSYDSVAFSALPDGEGAFQMNLVSRLSQEVRTTTTTGDIQALRQAVASGEYVPDPMAIAGKMLFLVGD